MNGTPRSWRAAALAILGGGFVVGLVLTPARRPLVSIAVLAAIAAAAVASIARASRRAPIARAADRPAPGRESQPAADDPSGSRPLTFSVVVAARDECGVIGDIVRDVAAQDHRDAAGTPCFELVVIDDRSVDGTGDVARSAAAGAGIGPVTRVVRREGEDLSDGKGAALTAAQPGDCRGDVVVVLDADARVGPSFLGNLSHYFETGAVAVTPRRRVLGAGTGAPALTNAQADEQTLDGALQRARWAMGGCSEFRGNGISVRRDLLARVGGWRAAALTEDLDLSTRIAAAEGSVVAWAVDAEAWEEPVTTWRSLWRQRLRWAEGSARRLFEHGPAVLASDRLRVAAKVDFLAYAGQVVAPSVVLGAAAGGIALGRPLAGATVWIAYVGTLGVIAWDALRWEVDATGARLFGSARIRRAVLAGLFNSIWVGAVPVALWQLATRDGPVRYDKMAHGDRTPQEA